MKRAGVVDGRLMLELSDGSSISVDCIHEPYASQIASEIMALRNAAESALHEMCHTVAPRDSFTDTVDALDAALHGRPGRVLMP